MKLQQLELMTQKVDLWQAVLRQQSLMVEHFQLQQLGLMTEKAELCHATLEQLKLKQRYHVMLKHKKVQLLGLMAESSRGVPTGVATSG